MQEKRVSVDRQLERIYGDNLQNIKQSLTTIESLLSSVLPSSNELQHQNRLLESSLKQADQLLLQETDERDRDAKFVQKLQKTVASARVLKVCDKWLRVPIQNHSSHGLSKR